ncbi:uncharacterized protein K02A2.6-like [Macrosteles quadrilineatus]|uniref:uncharacterized protein K02A2.6-like n=1 Tax=Macrosteles quadrilineatus TaxID=74068 RepID=UPI0023E2B84E|nr:uncharacterized protein K02A2.6-like [Macrosteles quadrilineatus]
MKGLTDKKKIAQLLCNSIGSNDDDYSSDNSSDYGVHKIDSIYQNFDVVDLFKVRHDSDKYIVSVSINGRSQCYKVDSGAKFSLLAKNDFGRLHLNVPVEPSRPSFRSYFGDITKPEGKVSVSVSYKGKQFKGDLHIVPSGHDALLGRQWIRGLGIELCEIDAEMNRPATTLQLQPVNSVEELFEKFAPIFGPKIGCVPNFTVSLHLRSGAKPIFNRERNVPHALIDQVNKELDLLEIEGIISPVTSSGWGSPLVVIPKADGSVRLCVDYKCDVSTVTSPLRCLLRKNKKWEWTPECEKAFQRIKTELCSNRILLPFDPKLPLVLTTDASPTGLAAVLSHLIDGTERPIAYNSRSLTDAECNNSQLDREALAIVFGVSHFYYYLFGTRFQLVTDNQPISRIFRHDKALPQMTSARLLRYSSYLSGFNYKLVFKKGMENKNVDCFSRAPLTQTHSTKDKKIGKEVHQICSQVIFQISSHEITVEIIKNETAKDPVLSKILKDLLTNSTDSDFTLVENIIFRGERVYIPSLLRNKILNELHESHLGITKMKQLARRYVYWPNIDKDIEHLVKGCENCALPRSNPPKAPNHPWEIPKENWERIKEYTLSTQDRFKASTSSCVLMLDQNGRR